MLFTNPKVGDIVRLLVENSKNMPKSDEELLEGARTVLKKAYSEILGLNEEDVTDDTDFFAAGGGKKRRKRPYFLFPPTFRLSYPQHTCTTSS